MGYVVSAPPGSTKPPRGCGWLLVVVGGLLLAMGALSLAAIPKLWKRSQEVWTGTRGTLVESYLKEGKRRSSDAGSRTNPSSTYDTYDVRLKYRYHVDGKEYHGDEKAPRQPEDDEKWLEAKAAQESYKSGDTIEVYYKPDDPKRSRFTATEPGIEFKKDIFVVVAYLLVGGVLFRLGRKLLRPKPSMAT